MIEILYLNWNRREFAEVSLSAMLRNTLWPLVSRVVAYDDGSTDGAREVLNNYRQMTPVPGFELRDVTFRSPPITMNDYLSTAECDMFVKLDSDIAVPPGWLQAMLSVMVNHPELELLGMEAGRTGTASEAQGADEEYGYEPASHIGGVGMMRTSAFQRRPPLMSRGRFGFTKWQETHTPVRGWIKPDIRAVQLDRLPFEPFRSLAASYVEEGWARSWSAYDPLVPYWWDWLREDEAA